MLDGDFFLLAFKVKIFLTDVAKGLTKLIDFYDIDIKRITDGVIEFITNSGVKRIFKASKNQTLNAEDCYLLANQSLLNSDQTRTKQWLTQALNKTSGNRDSDLTKNIVESMKMLDKNSEIFKSNSDNGLRKLEGTDKFIESNVIARTKSLCHGHKLLDHSLLSQLKCYYLSTRHKPYLRLMKIRLEELYKNPDLVMIHQFLTDREIDFMINTVKSRLEPQTVVTDDMIIERDSNRLAQGAAIVERIDRSGVANTINRRISAVTGNYEFILYC